MCPLFSRRPFIFHDWTRSFFFSFIVHRWRHLLFIYFSLVRRRSIHKSHHLSKRGFSSNKSHISTTNDHLQFFIIVAITCDITQESCDIDIANYILFIYRLRGLSLPTIKRIKCVSQTIGLVCFVYILFALHWNGFGRWIIDD